MDISDIERQIGKGLSNEKGMGGVVIWRQNGDSLSNNGDTFRHCSVGEFLARPENQKGKWLIDGGWGGPPGPIHVRWNDRTGQWENGGFGGRRFED